MRRRYLLHTKYPNLGVFGADGGSNCLSSTLVDKEYFFNLEEPIRLPSHHRPANILGFFGEKKKHHVFSPAAADKTLHALKLFLKLGK